MLETFARGMMMRMLEIFVNAKSERVTKSGTLILELQTHLCQVKEKNKTEFAFFSG